MNWRKCVCSFRADISLKPWCIWLLKWGLCRSGFTLCGGFVFLNGFWKTISHKQIGIIVCWKCSGSYLVCCVLDKVHVILESRRVQTLLKLIPIFAVVYLAGDVGGVSYCSLPICRKQSGSWGGSYSWVYQKVPVGWKRQRKAALDRQWLCANHSLSLLSDCWEGSFIMHGVTSKQCFNAEG